MHLGPRTDPIIDFWTDHLLPSEIQREGEFEIQELEGSPRII